MVLECDGYEIGNDYRNTKQVADSTDFQIPLNFHKRTCILRNFLFMFENQTKLE